MKHVQFVKLLEFLDSFLWDYKVTITNYRYHGIILDRYFDNSILSIDYLDLEDYMQTNGGFKFNEEVPFVDQYSGLAKDKQLILLQNVMSILNCTSLDKEEVEDKLNKIINFVKWQMIIIEEIAKEQLILSTDKIINCGSYCNIIFVEKGILRKELKPEHCNNTKLQKRMKYEFENMKKLQDCPHILNVFNFDENTNTYLMEEAEMNLYEYLNKEVDISFETKIKIINDVLQGMNFAHKNSIIHRDLHLGNILKISNDFLIADFGLSKDESIVRSLKSSSTEKNNHIFMDPQAYGDFSKLDKKSDIYSIGRLIDYIVGDGKISSNHMFTYIVEKCTNRDKEKRYENIESILTDIDFFIKEKSKELDRKVILENILNDILNIQVSEYILELVKQDRLCDYIVINRLYNFGRIIMQFDTLEQIEILVNINSNYSEATGYGGWSNYDIFADISYYVCRNTKERKVFDEAKDILEGCASIRYTAADYLKRM